MYIRICSSLKDKGTLIPTTDNIEKYIKSQNQDYYVSVYQYNEKQKEQFDKKGSIAGIRDVITNKLIFDFDSNDIEDARSDALETISRLEEYGVDKSKINIYFSGNKGFHLSLNTDKNFKPRETKAIAKEIAGDLKTFDSVVYNSNRILRVPNTKHQVSNLYKVPLEYEELKTSSIDEIKDIASMPYEFEDELKCTIPKKITDLSEITKNETNNESNLLNELDLSKRPKYLSPWKYALEEGFFPPGQRNNALIILAATYKNLGYNETKCYHALRAAAELQADRFNQEKFSKKEIYENIISEVYAPHWLGGTYAEDNFPEQLKDYLKDLGVPRQEEDKLEVFQKTSEVFSTFQNFAKNIDKNTLKTGIKPLDETVQLTTGMLVGLLGAPSSGKTSVALEALKNNSLKGEDCVFYSMDMGANLVFQRLAQKVSGYNSKKLFDIFKNDDLKEIESIKNKIDKQYDNVHFCFKTASTVENIRKSLKYQQDKLNKRVRLVTIDYLECINSTISDPNAKISSIVQELKDLAIDFDTCVLLLLQPPKRVGDPSKEILSYVDIKGSSAIQQACSVIISLWRDGFDPKTIDNDKFMSFAVLKNRMGKLSQIDCGFNGLTGSIYRLEDIEREELKELRNFKDNKNEGDFDI